MLFFWYITLCKQSDQLQHSTEGQDSMLFLTLFRFLRTQCCTSGRVPQLIIRKSSARWPKLAWGSCWLPLGTSTTFPMARTGVTTTTCSHWTFLVCAWQSNIIIYNLGQLCAGDVDAYLNIGLLIWSGVIHLKWRFWWIVNSLPAYLYRNTPYTIELNPYITILSQVLRNRRSWWSEVKSACGGSMLMPPISLHVFGTLFKKISQFIKLINLLYEQQLHEIHWLHPKSQAKGKCCSRETLEWWEADLQCGQGISSLAGLSLQAREVLSHFYSRPAGTP